MREGVGEGVLGSATEVGSEELSNVQLSRLTDVINESTNLTESDKQQLIKQAQELDTKQESELTDIEKKIIQTVQLLSLKKELKKLKKIPIKRWS